MAMRTVVRTTGTYAADLGEDMLEYQDVFVPGGFPRHTYNPRTELQLEARLVECKQNLCKLVTVTGHTKSGKTVLARRVLPEQDAIWVNGGSVAKREDDFWLAITEKLDLFQTTQQETSTETRSALGARASAGVKLVVAQGTGEVSGSWEDSHGSTQTSSRTISSRVAALEGLKQCRIPLVVDDFHYLDREIQGAVVRALKPLIFDGLPVVVIAIPHRRYDAMKVEREMTGRVLHIEIPVWSEDELRFIPETGFRLLERPLAPDLCSRLAREAIGSPHLMQDFCRGLCRLAVASDAVFGPAVLSPSVKGVDGVLHEVAETIGRPIFEKLAKGPRQRTDRVPRKLKDGRSVDIYQLVLHALAHRRPGLESLEYEDLRAAIREVSEGQIPQLHEVARVLKHMATIAASDESSTPVIDFEEDEKKLHVTDPFFAFYLRWGQLAS